MTEAEWMAAESPKELLLWLGAKSKRRRTVRKTCLFAVACGEHVKSFMTQPMTLRGLELAERMAEGAAGEAECNAYLAELRAEPHPNQPVPSMAWNIPSAILHVMLPHRTGQSSEKHAVNAFQTCAGIYYATNDIPGALQEIAAQTELLRDIVGNPFRPVVVDPSWLTSTVVVLAQQMYESRDFSPMPILADALQETGCDNEDVLTHSRGHGLHVRGCWVIDLLLGKE